MTTTQTPKKSTLTHVRNGRVSLIWPHCDGLIWPHFRHAGALL